VETGQWPFGSYGKRLYAGAFYPVDGRSSMLFRYYFEKDFLIESSGFLSYWFSLRSYQYEKSPRLESTLPK
jgi:hypothetical protein